MKNVFERQLSGFIETGLYTLPNIYWLKIIIDVLALHHLTNNRNHAVFFLTLDSSTVFSAGPNHIRTN